MRTRLALFALALGIAAHSHAADGVLEINQTCAVQTGCFAGDAAAFPVLIAAPGSYRLTSNLILPNENADGIMVQASDVSVDLAGFAIVRSGCEATTSNCTPASGTGAGIRRTSASRRAIAVRNGSITGMGEYGVVLGQQAEVTNLRVRWNRVAGIFADVGSRIADSLAYQNGGIGIDAVLGQATISDCLADGNGDSGIRVGDGSAVSRSVASSNGNDGIQTGDGSTVSHSTSHSNSDIGILTLAGTTVDHSTAYGNGFWGIRVGEGSTVSGSTAYANGNHGIAGDNGCLVHGSTARNNTLAGLFLDQRCGFRENVITSNATGTVEELLAGTVVNLGANVCTDAADNVVACP